MTNGEKIKELFPHFDVEDKTEYFGRIRNLDDHFIKADIDFWNAEYKGPTTKNDLEVNTDKLISDCEKMSFDIEIFNKPLKVVALDAVKNIVKDLPSVTPQEPTDKIFTKADLDSMAKAINYGWELRVNEVLDKIRAEIMDCLKALDDIEKSGVDIYLPNEILGRRLTYQQCLGFIDKHKAESEPQESNIEIRKPCINYEDGCEEWAGCPCVYYKAESEE